ncbi:MFS transporter [Bradyrhizobium septentrionale]|uniref:MFS transporter n=1 Tax=Bradyrhizobium septentrionale TaxID=1404411 RepID=A0ABZ2NZR8_9BRAD
MSSAARVLPALLAVSIQKDLGWQISDVAWPITFGIAVSASASPLATRGLERWGVRWPLVVSLVLLAVSLASTTLATSPGHLVLAWGLGLGCSGSLSASILGAMVGSRRSAAHCGTRFGLLTSMQFLGSAAGLLLASRAVEAFGWRIAFHAAAVVVLTTAFVVVLLVPASGREVTPQQSASSRHAPSYPEGRGWRFWALAAIFCICGASTSGLIDSQLSILCMGAGLGLSSSADVMAIFLLGGAIGSVASGYLADRYPARMLLAGYFVARALILLWLLRGGDQGETPATIKVRLRRWGRTEGRAQPDRRTVPIGVARFWTRLAAGCGWCKLLVRLDKRESMPCLASTSPTTR